MKSVAVIIVLTSIFWCISKDINAQPLHPTFVDLVDSPTSWYYSPLLPVNQEAYHGVTSERIRRVRRDPPEYIIGGIRY
ncbi:hypothetical protein EG68_04337 [Paragonimus skrjabini miyazakii]|uniref:Uncharacterized protein n=1 Tax=Paragonimus skrjabini miyazakii TaxID=59628 RepID=A0A8S9Z823_9TREM|nr:hypothetical protein EG68_04337 [Paragonimus skrjabini miyazakii]